MQEPSQSDLDKVGQLVDDLVNNVYSGAVECAKGGTRLNIYMLVGMQLTPRSDYANVVVYKTRLEYEEKAETDVLELIKNPNTGGVFVITQYEIEDPTLTGITVALISRDMIHQGSLIYVVPDGEKPRRITTVDASTKHHCNPVIH